MFVASLRAKDKVKQKQRARNHSCQHSRVENCGKVRKGVKYPVIQEGA
jgi:hypothetical protein